MKNSVLALALCGFLGFGFFTLSTLPAKGDILCLVNCVNEKEICRDGALDFCLEDTPQQIDVLECYRNVARMCEEINCYSLCRCPI